MTDLPKSKAKRFLEDWASEDYKDDASSEDVVEMLTKLVNLVDEEFVQCSLEREDVIRREFEKLDNDADDTDDTCREAIANVRRHRLALWTVLIGGLKAALASEIQSDALNALNSSLIDLARGVPNVNAFDVPRTSRIFHIDELWNRASVIAALDQYPDRKQEILRKSARLLNLREAAIEKMVDNFRHGREPRSDLSDLVTLAKHHSEFWVEDLLD